MKFINPFAYLRSAALIAILSLLAFPSLRAQQSMTLGEALAATLENNFDIRIEEQRAENSRINNTWGAAGRYPSIAINISNGNRLSDIDNPASFLNGQFSNIGVNGTADLNWNLFSGFRVSITKARLEELERLSDGNVALVVENALQAVILQYYDCLVQQERLVVLESNLALSRDRYDYVETKKGLGTGTTFDLLTVENAYLADSSNLLLQRLTYDNSLRALGQLIGLEPGETVFPSEELRSDFGPYDQATLRAKMFGNNLTLQNQFVNLEILQKDVDLARANRYPAINLNLGSTYSTNRFQLEGRDPASGNQLDYYANFSLNFTLYNGGAVTRGIQNAEVNRRVAEISIGQMEQSMDYQLVNALAMYDTRRELLSLTEASLATAKKNLDIAEEKFRNGTLNSFNYRDVQVAYLSASFSRVQALYNLLDSETALTRITGGILDMVQ